MARIIWVQDEYKGPMNGLIEYNQEELWFSRLNNTREYAIYRIPSNIKQILTDNHIAYCQLTGSPLKHGDAFNFKSSLNDLLQYKHEVNPIEVKGDLIATIKEEDIVNYWISRYI